MKFLRTLTGKLIAGLVLVLLIVGGLYLKSCSEARQRAAQSKVDQGQAGAFRESVEDTMKTIGAAADRERASEDLSRSNEEEIRGAKGADAAVDPAARDAGMRALCRRAVYRNDPRCKQGAPR